MVKRVRNSAALATVTPITDHRPPARTTCPKAQAVVWRSVNQLPYGWLKAEHLPLLRAYCAHVAIGNELAKRVEEFRAEWLAADGGPGALRCFAGPRASGDAGTGSFDAAHPFSKYDKNVAARQARSRPQRMPWDADA
jgi:hypothetical protein